MDRTDRSRAIVIGAGIAGLLSARVLSDHVDEVVLLERDRLRPGMGNRRGVPQARHAHAVLAAARERIAEWFPDIVDQLQSHGAVVGDVGDALWHQAGAFRLRQNVGTVGIGLSCPLLEDVVRSRVAYLPNVTIHDAIPVDDIATADGRVVGVVAGGETLPADLVVDCSGRNTAIPERLAVMGFPEPPVSNVHVSVAYGTRILARRPGDIEAGYAAGGGGDTTAPEPGGGPPTHRGRPLGPDPRRIPRRPTADRRRRIPRVRPVVTHAHHRRRPGADGDPLAGGGPPPPLQPASPFREAAVDPRGIRCVGRRRGELQPDPPAGDVERRPPGSSSWKD